MPVATNRSGNRAAERGQARGRKPDARPDQWRVLPEVWCARRRTSLAGLGLTGLARSLVTRRVRTDAGVERGRAMEAPAFNDATICLGPEVRATILVEGKTTCRSRMRETPNASTSTTITRTSVRRLAAASNIGSTAEAVTSRGFRDVNFPRMLRAAGPASRT